VTAVARFYEWAVEEDLAAAVPFTHAWAKRFVHGQVRTVRRNLATLKGPKPHTTIKYLEADFAELFVRALEGLLPDGAPDPDFRGHDPGRNAAMAQFVLASGLRKREFTYLLAPEIPPLPPEPTVLPILRPVAGKIAKGGKQRTTWISYEALATMHRYLTLERPLATVGSSWRPDPSGGEPLVVTHTDWHGGVLNGRRRAWSRLSPAERLRLVDEQGGSLLVAVQRDGAARRGAVRGLGHGVPPGLGPDSRPVRAAVSARLSAPIATLVLPGDQLQRRLHDAISGGGNTKPAFLHGARFRDQLLPHRLRAKRPLLQFAAQSREEGDRLSREISRSDPVNSRRATTLVPPDSLPGVHQKRRIMHKVVQVLEHATRIPGRP
jgi:hypothetical protein